MKGYKKVNKIVFASANVLLTTGLIAMLNACRHSGKESAELEVIDAKDNPKAEINYTKSNKSGNTSIAHDAASKFKFSGYSPYRSGGVGYYLPDGTEVPYVKRDRDMGQTFKYTGDTEKKWKSVVIQTGFGDNVVRKGMYGKAISLQIFEVTGKPVLNENNSTGNTRAFHGFPHHRDNPKMTSDKDDYFVGEKYMSIQVISGYRFPSPADFGLNENEKSVSPDNKKLKGRYLRFSIPPKERPVLEPGKEYAFLIMIDSIGENRGFTVANEYHGKYEGGHAIRRGGSGIFPPVTADPRKDLTDSANVAAMEAAHFPSDMKKRSAIPPGTNGYPDVDTFRDLVFYIIMKN